MDSVKGRQTGWMCGKLAEIHEFMEIKISPSSGGRAADQRLNL
ncbi:hypothetical protein [Paenibacillus oleatilyticus]|uniref:Uncharacterized protein n=1 Tax=Paenibacillus oleatilyticus TaxID=2594886 RepID=A0ABV4VCW8_9BACL